MKVFLVHNQYRKPSGEEAVVNGIQCLLKEHNHEVIPFIRNSAEIETIKLGKLRSFFSGIYSRASRLAMRSLLREHQPNLVHIHNLFPLISPSILSECSQAGIPVVMTVHNYRMIRPNGLYMVRGQVCEKCHGGREFWCILRNCEGDLFKSAGYALRNYVSRKFRFYLDNVTIFATVTDFLRQRLIDAGFPGERIVVIPNMVSMSGNPGQLNLGDYVAFVGRVSPEKGVNILLQAAQTCGDIPFRVAGEFHRMPQLPAFAFPNAKFFGHLHGMQLEEFYAMARVVVVPSLWYEAFGLCTVEAMLHGKPVIASRIGGLPEIVEDGETGLLFESGNAVELAEKTRFLWNRPDLCNKMGLAGRAKALREYSPARYYERLLAAYEKALAHGP